MPDANSSHPKGVLASEPRDAGVVLARRRKSGRGHGVFGETVAEIVRVVCQWFSWRFSFCSLGHIRLGRRGNAGSNGQG
jgi:hypothetical protein